MGRRIRLPLRGRAVRPSARYAAQRSAFAPPHTAFRVAPAAPPAKPFRRVSMEVRVAIYRAAVQLAIEAVTD